MVFLPRRRQRLIPTPIPSPLPSLSPCTGQDHPAPPHVLEYVEGLQSLDVHVLIAQLVGAVQAQAQQTEQLDNRDARRAAQIAEQAAVVEAQAEQHAKQAEQIEQQAARFKEHDARLEKLRA